MVILVVRRQQPGNDYRPADTAVKLSLSVKMDR